jgi:hypothetical protein
MVASSTLVSALDRLRQIAQRSRSLSPMSRRVAYLSSRVKMPALERAPAPAVQRRKPTHFLQADLEPSVAIAESCRSATRKRVLVVSGTPLAVNSACRPPQTKRQAITADVPKYEGPNSGRALQITSFQAKVLCAWRCEPTSGARSRRDREMQRRSQAIHPAKACDVSRTVALAASRELAAQRARAWPSTKATGSCRCRQGYVDFDRTRFAMLKTFGENA